MQFASCIFCEAVAVACKVLVAFHSSFSLLDRLDMWPHSDYMRLSIGLHPTKSMLGLTAVDAGKIYSVLVGGGWKNCGRTVGNGGKTVLSHPTTAAASQLAWCGMLFRALHSLPRSSSGTTTGPHRPQPRRAATFEELGSQGR